MVVGAIKNIFDFITGILDFLWWVIGLFKPFPGWIWNLFIAVAVLLSVSPLLLSLQGVRDLEPLFVAFAFFYLCVFIVRIFLWPKQMPKNPLPDLSKSSQSFIERLLFYGIPLMFFFWLLVVFGVVDQVNDNLAQWAQYFNKNSGEYYNTLINLPSLTVPNTDYIIPGGVVLVVGILAFILLIRRLLRRKKG